MAGNLMEILFRVRGDTSDAQRKVKAVGDEADRTKTKLTQVERAAARAAAQAERAASRTAARLNQIRSRTRSGLGAAGGAIAAGGNVGEVTLAALGAAVPEAGTGLVLAETVTNVVNRLMGRETAATRTQRQLEAPISTRDAMEQLVKRARQRGRAITFDTAGIGRGFRQLGDILTGDRPFDPRRESRRELHKLFRDMARSNLPLAMRVLVEMGSPADLVKIIDEVKAENVRQGQSERFLESLKPATTKLDRRASEYQTAINIYTGIYAGSGLSEEQIGREVRAVLDRRDRANGRYTSAITRPGS